MLDCPLEGRGKRWVRVNTPYNLITILGEKETIVG